MKKDHPDAHRKKIVAELLKNADKLLKSGEYEQALAEVEKGLELEPGNFYAQAYKERIITLREKHGDAPPSAKPAVPSSPPAEAAPQPADLTLDAPGEAESAGRSDGQPEADVDELREQHARERTTQESETERQAEEIARRALEAEINQGAEAEKIIAAEREATEQALEEGRARARAEFIAGAEAGVAKLLAAGDVEGAFTELTRLAIADPGNGKLADLRSQVDEATGKTLAPAAAEPREVSRETIGVIFGKMLKEAWTEGTPNEVQAGAVARARERLQVTPEEEKSLMTKVQREVIAEAMRAAYRDGDPDPETKSFLDRLTTELSAGARASH